MAPQNADTQADDTRARLLREAAHQFARKGFDGASLRAIGDAVGIRAASIFHHFPGGKQELYESIFGTIIELVGNLVATRVSKASDSPVDNIRDMALSFWDFFAEHPEFAGLMLRESFNPEGAPLGGVNEQAATILSVSHDYMISCMDAGTLARFDPTALALWATLCTVTFHGAPGIQRHIAPGGETGESAEWARKSYARTLDMFLRGEALPPPTTAS